MKKSELPGLALAVVRDGKVEKAKGYGWADVELQVPATERSVFQWASVTKQFTATAIMQLVQDKLTVIVLANTAANPQAIATSVAGHYVPGLTLASLEPQPDPEPALSERLRQCLVEMAEKKDSEILTPEFRENFSNSRRRHAALQEALKRLQSFVFVIEEKPDASQRNAGPVPVERLRSYKLVTDDEARFYTFALTADGKVALVQADG